MKVSKLDKEFVLQHGQSDCGPACIASIIHYHQGEYSLDEIRRVTGTTQTGTKLLGLLQGAKSLHFDANGMQADSIENLKELDDPAILHVVVDNRIQHYVVFYGFDGKDLIIGDPAKGVSLWTVEDLLERWHSKTLLKLSPNQNFEKSQNRKKGFSQILSWVKEDFNILISALFMGIVVSILSLSIAIFSQKLVDVILPSKDYTKLIVGIILFALVLMVKAGLGFVRSSFLNVQSKDFNNRMIQSFFDSLLRLPKPFFDSKKIGEMIARMNDTRRIQTTVSSLVGNLVIEALVVVTSIVGIFIYSWQIGVIVSLFLPIYFLVLWSINTPIIKAQKEVMDKYALNEGNYVDVINGIQEVKATNTVSLFHKSTTAIYALFQESIFNLGKIQIKFNFRTEFVGLLLIVSVIAFSSYLVITGELMLGVMIAVLSLSGSVGPSLSRIALFNIQLQEAKVAFSRMEEFTTLETENTKGISVEKINSLRVSDLSFSYPGSLPILKKIDIEISKGRITTLLGESGTGKSTILQLILRFYSPTNGSISIDGKDIQNLELQAYREKVSVVPQDIKIFNSYLAFNIALSDDPKVLDQVMSWCEKKGFDKYFSKFPQGMMTLLGEEGANISGGQKQLVGLARALYRNPDLLLIDEGTSSLDRKTEAFVIDLLDKHKREMAVFMITHRVETAKRADHIYTIENGVITNSGHHEHLVEYENYYSSLYDHILN
ncbi:peptidase domain-containing ABC transporter [Ekhidna sp.]|jgi:ABC-type bacteriocin/lantibiotic exporter with double-glycine peptidase domain|uniref:peptidase domain-containing ABC transporter n=1 Tax=Ekhidna sp. TaxID=2608089 RepID=UPI0032EBF9DE